MGQVVVGDLVALAGNSDQNTVSSTVEGLSELDTEGAHGGLEIAVETLLNGLAESNTFSLGLVNVSLHGFRLVTNVGAVLLVGLVDLECNTSQLLGVTLRALGVGSNNVGQHGHLGGKHC